MLTLRIPPPRLLSRRPREPRDLTGLYFDALWENWRARDRALALLLAVGAGLINLTGLDRRAFLNGWSASEEALNARAADRTAHLGMAARKGLNRIVNPGAYPLESNPLKNKRLFALRAAAAGLPVPPDFSGTPGALGGWLAGEVAVVAKPNFSSKGGGVAGYRRDRGGWTCCGERLGEDAAVERLARVLAAGGIVQRACLTHPALVALSPGALPTLRVMTAVNERGEIETCGRVLRLSGGGVRAVDNFNAGNLAAGVGPDGRADFAWRKAGRGVERLDRHPATGAAIASAAIPDLAAAEHLAIRAHRLLADGFRLVGWDVGLSDAGPALIEGNWNPGTDILQLAAGRGVGDARLGALYRGWIAETPQAAWRAARPVETEPRRDRRARAPGSAVSAA